MDIVTREEWGGEPREYYHVPDESRTEFFVHWDGDKPVLLKGRAIPQRIEKAHAKKNWNGVGYNFVVDNDGTIYEGRGWSAVGAHCENHNRSGWGVQVAIGVGQTPSEAALRSVRALYEEAARRSGKGANLLRKGHRDEGSTQCPGDDLYGWVHSGMPVSGEPTQPTAPTPPSQPNQKSLATLVREVLDGKHGSGDARKASLGARYDEVQAEVNRVLNVTKNSDNNDALRIHRLATEVLAGKHGTGNVRRQRLGKDYDAVQAEVNRRFGKKSLPSSNAYAERISRLAREVLDGRHGDGAVRRRRLGRDYKAVQAEVNRLLR